MELYYVISVLDRDRSEQLIELHRRLNISVVLSGIGRGTATTALLSFYDIAQKEKSLICAVATSDSVRKLMKNAVSQMYFDIPGNGVMMAIPIKSVSGGKSLSYFTEGQTVEGTVPDMNFENELIIIILNEGYSDEVMDVAREAGATGGTVLHAKGTGSKENRFFSVSLAEEKDIIFVLASSEIKSAIMSEVNRKCGTDTECGAVCFSLPVSEVIGIRKFGK